MNHSRFSPTLRPFLIALAVLALALGWTFSPAFSPGQVAYNNDGPLGAMRAYSDDHEGLASGFWQNLNWVGTKELSATPNLTHLFYFLIGPGWWGEDGVVQFYKFYALGSLLFLGLTTWFLFRQLRFATYVGVLAGLAAALNSNAVSYACWGLPGKALTMSCTIFAVAILQGDRSGWRGWARYMLAGFAAGLGVMEGADVGAILSLYIAAYVAFLSATEAGPVSARVGRGMLRLCVVAVCAVVIASYSLQLLISTQIQGIAGMAQDAQSRAQQWDAATGWSFPKLEMLRFLVPGIFGYRMDSPDGGAYWGSVGSEGIPPRWSGSGEYAGLPVLLVAVWASIRVWFRGKDDPFTDFERKHIFFWSGLALLSALFAFGRYAPFYQVVYSLPYFSTIRIPMKFLHPFAICLVILFGHGLQGIWRIYLAPTSLPMEALFGHFSTWWKEVKGFDRVWSRVLVALVLGGVLGAILYSGSRDSLVAAVKAAPTVAGTPEAVIGHSIYEVWIFAILFAVTALAWLVIASGWFHGPGASKAAWMLGLLLAVDLLRANAPWVIYYDSRNRYQSNPVLDLLKQKPEEHRVTSYLDPRRAGILIAGPGAEAWPYLQKLWLENHFQYYRIQSLDIIQMPRMQKMDLAFITNFTPTSQATYTLAVRRWELTGARYILTGRGMDQQLNEVFDPGQRRFRLVMPFGFVPKPGAPANLGGTIEEQLDNLTAVVQTNGAMALLEFSGALPRVKLYSQWETIPDEERTLARLRAPEFDPHSSVLVGEDPGLTPASGPSTGEASIIHYSPKGIEVRTKSTKPGILLLNERWHPDWRVTVDGSAARLLRGNYLMRSVALPPGEHTVVFRFTPPAGILNLSFAAVSVGLALCGLLTWDSRRRPA